MKHLCIKKIHRSGPGEKLMQAYLVNSDAIIQAVKRRW